MDVRLFDIDDRLPNGSFSLPGRFVLTAALLLGVAALLPEDFLLPLNRASAAATVLCLEQLGYAPVRSGTFIQLEGFRADVITECSVLYPALLFGAFLLTLPASGSRRIVGLSLGLPALFSLNTVRLAAVIVAGATAPRLFEVLHVYLGQVLMVLAVCLLALLWLRWSGEEGESCWNVPFPARLGFWSAVIFLPWLFLNRLYVEASDRPIAWIFSLLGHPLYLPSDLPLYYQTFNVVTFAALFLATRPPWKTGSETWIKGFFALWLGHQAFRVCNVLMTAYGIEFAFHVSILVHIASQYVLPVALWLLLAKPGWSVRPSAFFPPMR